MLLLIVSGGPRYVCDHGDHAKSVMEIQGYICWGLDPQTSDKNMFKKRSA